MTVTKWARKEVKTRVLYLTKYALSAGIEIHNMRETDDPNRFYHPDRFTSFKLGVDCFETEAEAIEDFGKRKAAKIESLTKTMSRTARLKIKVTDKTKMEVSGRERIENA